MNHIDILKNLIRIAGEENVAPNESMSEHTTFKVGGNADFFVTPETEDQLRNMLLFCKEGHIPYFVIGNGSNLLVSDSGYRGIIIQIGNKMSSIEVTHQENHSIVTVQAGISLGRLGNEILKHGLTGFEFACGIPGTIGGAVMMNAGAYGGEMSGILSSAKVMDDDGRVMELSSSQLELGYRTSIISRKGYIVIEAKLKLQKGRKEEIKEKMQELAVRRKEKQPLEMPSAGSTFKRPEGNFAGKLITEAGLKGYSVGGAQVSTKHAGFVVNTGTATAQDILRLTDEVRMAVKEKSGIELELEVKKLGFDK